jgi:hypothetical protein
MCMYTGIYSKRVKLYVDDGSQGLTNKATKAAPK